jgi:hypothetical protein
MLDRQVNLFKVDTNAFLTNEEKEHRKYLVKLKKVREKVYKKVGNREETMKDTINKLKNNCANGKNLTKYEKYLIHFTNLIKSEEHIWKEYILQSAKDAVEYNNTHNDKHIRELDERYLSYIDQTDGVKKVNLSNVISMFESTLSRSFGISTNELTYDIFVLEIFYYDIAQDLILNGFNYNGKHYVYFSSSAGQIRTKKAVFVEEEKYEQCKLKLMCGLTIDRINEKGGMNINKFLAYLALANSATDLWEDVFGRKFDIDRTIVVDDFETLVKCKVDNIDYETYEITSDVVKDIPIPHTDGCGLISSDYCKKNFMVRLPFIKGLLGSFDYKKFIQDNNCSSKVIDIWGKEYDIFEDDIQIIFTKSQLKMYKYYDSWDEYKTYFKQYHCEAGICNMEEDNISNAKINYQMLQTLYDASDAEIKDMCKVANSKIQSISDSLENALDFFGVNLDEENESKKDWFQKSLKIYPELLNDPASKDDLRDLKNSMIKKYRGAKLDVVGKFTFVLPDLYAFCEWLFIGIETPLGLLENDEVFCRLYRNVNQLDCLRSPHLYIEHAIRKNVCNKKYRNQRLSEWFNTDAIYTSTYDPISRILQFDVDGDRLLVLAQKKLITIAERCMNGVNPLYYEMKKANAEEINYQNIYNGLKLAFTGGRIGGISNDITKIWNSGEITEESLKAVRWLCMETNFTIDYAKTLFKPIRPKEVDKILKKYGKQKVPYFFQYAKDKKYSDDEKKSQCEKLNDSVINKIVKEIKDNRNMFRPIKNLDDINYLLFLKDKIDYYSNDEINKIFDRWNKKYGNNVNINEDDDTNKNNLHAVAVQVKKDLNAIEPDDNKVINSLVVFLYKNSSTRKKKLFWYIYGEQLYNNLLYNIEHKNICRQCGCRTNEELIRNKCFKCRQEEIKKLDGKKLIKCKDCGKDVIVDAKSRIIRCEECHKIERSKAASESRKKKMLTSS